MFSAVTMDVGCTSAVAEGSGRRNTKNKKVDRQVDMEAMYNDCFFGEISRTHDKRLVDVETRKPKCIVNSDTDKRKEAKSKVVQKNKSKSHSKSKSKNSEISPFHQSSMKRKNIID